MKRSLLRFLTSVYIMIVSVVLIVISAYAWFTISDAPMTQAVPMGVAGRDAIGLPDKDYSIWDGFSYKPGDERFTATQDENGTYIITNVTEFVSVLKLAEDDSVGSIAMRLEADLSLADWLWEPINVKTDTDAKVITIHGNGKELVCATAPLFSGSSVGSVGIMVSDLTIAHSSIRSADLGAGAFVGSVRGMELVVLDNCHLYASDVIGQNTGGLIGWTEGYSDEGETPVQSNVQILDCTVDSCQLTAANAVGGIIGHAGADAATNHLIRDCSVTNTVLRSNHPEVYQGVGTILGVANFGTVYVTDCSASEITEVVSSGLDHENTSFLIYGREDYGMTGKLVITENGETTVLGNQDMTFFVSTPGELATALQYSANPDFAYNVTINIIDDIDMSGYEWKPATLATEDSEAALTINGQGHKLYGLTAPLLGGTLEQRGLETLEIRDLTIADSNIVSTNTVGNGAFIECVNGLISVTMENCHLLSSTITGDESVGTRTGGLIGWTYAARTAKGTAKDTIITVTGCSVTGSTLTSYGTVGGLIGHVGAHPKADHLISGCSVTDTTLNSIEPGDGYKGVGTMVGTINQGSATIENCVSSGNTEYSHDPVPEIYNEDGLEYGRLALSTVGRACVINENGTMNFGSGSATFDVSTEAGLRKALEYVSCESYSGNITINLNNDIAIENAWTPVWFATVSSSDNIVIDGNEHSISGLTAPFLEGGKKLQWGQEALEIRNLTIKESPNMVCTGNITGNGAFIECVAGMRSLTMTNCHLVDVSLSSVTEIVNGKVEGPRTGGLIGWTASGTDDAGARIERTLITVSSCTVKDSTITGYGTVGGIIGHAGYNDNVVHLISDCTVSGNTLESTESPYKGVGPILGTANVGIVSIDNCEVDNNNEIVPTECMEDNSTEILYGRFVPNTSGMLVIDGEAVEVTPVTTTTTTTTTATTGGTTTTEPTTGTGTEGGTNTTEPTTGTGTEGGSNTEPTTGTGTEGGTNTEPTTGTGTEGGTNTTEASEGEVDTNVTTGGESESESTTPEAPEGETNTNDSTDGESESESTTPEASEGESNGENVAENTGDANEGLNEQSNENAISTEETPAEESSSVEVEEKAVEAAPVA